MAIPIPDWYIRHRIVLAILLVVAAFGILVATLIPYLGRLNLTRLEIGDVAAQDYIAPYAIVYESKVLTEQKRQEASQSIQPVYTSVDTSIARRQLEKLRTALTYISSIRSDSFATIDEKLIDLSAMQDIFLSHDTAEKILALSETRWLLIQQEAIAVLERVMRSTIRADRVDETLRSVPALVSLSLPEDQASIAADLAVAFVLPNSFYDPGQTEKAVQEVQDSIGSVSRTFVDGQTIVAGGQVIDTQSLEALQQFGLTQSQLDWREIVSGVVLTALVISFFLIYLYRTSRLIQDNRGPIIFTSLFLTFLLGARLIIPNHTILPYLFPTMAFCLTLVVLFGSELALVSAFPLAVLVAYQLPRPLELILFNVFGSFFGVWMLLRVRRVTSFFIAGLAAAGGGIAAILIFRLPDPNTDWLGLLTLCSAALASGLASAVISLLLQFYLAQFLGKISPLQLIELTRPDHPMLQFLLRNAPGTYQHSLQVANLAEQAAERIGADGLLTRVGAMYHDAGKALNPYFFVENQPAGEINLHDDLDPALSAATIIRHVTDGLELARKYRMPRRIQDFISEHHGRLLTRYQYVRSVERAGGDETKVNPEKYRYPGPSPTSHETALLMLADGCEARVRAEHPRTEEELRQVIRNQVDNRLKAGELNNVNLTLRQLDMIVDSFTETMRGIYHPRIDYPQLNAVPARNELPESKAEERDQPDQGNVISEESP